MAVYVDPLFNYGGSATFRWTDSCHMYADDLEELHALAAKIGLKRAWFQDKPTLPHYDLTASKRVLAVKAGAKEVSHLKTMAMVRKNRKLKRMINEHRRRSS